MKKYSFIKTQTWNVHFTYIFIIFQLYNYVLSHEATYAFKVVRMEPIFVMEATDNLDLDYALVRHTKCQLSFKVNPGNDLQGPLLLSDCFIF